MTSQWMAAHRNTFKRQNCSNLLAVYCWEGEMSCAQHLRPSKPNKSVIVPSCRFLCLVDAFSPCLDKHKQEDESQPVS